ncbi:hypothetical protein F511_31819 [Dorcoceras hygrometricum]|uniref:Uncharacterized protein n=1 Tax=Dorcoceras hygrometricum TaxID=472368 RepID=A0A2Z7AGY1_9LAMI|nr:hypothetical protein F511_31819 [Dorcoceras hygrometricum]
MIAKCWLLKKAPKSGLIATQIHPAAAHLQARVNKRRFTASWLTKRKHDRKVLVAEESTKIWADSDSDTSSSSSSSSESEQEEVHCFMADQTDEDEVFDFSNVEFTRDDLVIELNDMVKEYRKLSQSFEEAKAENMSLKSSSAESSSDELEDADILKTELSKLQAENEMLRNEISELKADVAKSTVELSSWNKANLTLQKICENQKQASDKTVIGFNDNEVRPASVDDVDVIIEQVIVETAQMGADEEEIDIGGAIVSGSAVGSQAVEKADEFELCLNLSYEEFYARQAKQPVVTASDTDEDIETIDVGAGVGDQQLQIFVVADSRTDASTDYTVTEPVEEMEKAAVEQSADEAMSPEDILMTIPVDCPLPSAEREVTKIQLGKSISIPGVQEGDWYKASLPKIPATDKGKALLQEKDPVKGNPVQEQFSLIVADIDLLVQLRELVIDEVDKFFNSFSLKKLAALQTDENCPLPSAEGEVTKIQLGKSISIPGVHEGEWYKASLPKIPATDKGKAPLMEIDPIKGNPIKEQLSLILTDIEVLVQLREQIIDDVDRFFNSFSLKTLAALQTDDISAKEELVLNWAEADSKKFVLQRRHFILTKYRELLIQKFLEAHRANFVPGDVQAHRLKWDRTCCSQIFEGRPRDRGAVIARTNSNTRSTCWIRTIILVDGVWVVELCGGHWVKIPQRIVNNEILRHRSYADTLPLISKFFQLMKMRWADICIEFAQFSVSVDIRNFVSYIAEDRSALRVVQSVNRSVFVSPHVQFIASSAVEDQHIQRLLYQRPFSSSSSDDSSMHFVEDDIPLGDDAASTQFSLPTAATHVPDSFAQLRASIDQLHFEQIRHKEDFDKLRDTLLMHIRDIEKKFSERIDAHDRTYRVLLNNIHHDARDHKNFLSLDLKSSQQKLSTQVAAAAFDTVDVRKEVKELNAKVTFLDGQGEGGSSRPQPPPDDQSRPSWGSGGSGSRPVDQRRYVGGSISRDSGSRGRRGSGERRSPGDSGSSKRKRSSGGGFDPEVPLGLLCCCLLVVQVFPGFTAGRGYDPAGGAPGDG